MTKALSCPICQHKQSTLIHQLNQGELIACNNCGVVFFSPMPTPEELNIFYNNGYHEGFGQSRMAGISFAQSRYQSLASLLRRHSPVLFSQPERKLLDIGCGTGDFLAVAKQEGWDITGTELSKEAIVKATKKLGGCVIEGDVLNLSLPHDSYDLITSYHVIEHILAPVEMFKKCYQSLSEQGVFFVETPNIKSLGARVRGSEWSHIIPPEHIVYFTPKSLSYALKKVGFSRIKILTSTPQVIESIQNWPTPIKQMAKILYDLAPIVGMGAALQAIAFKD